jgi:Tyrosine-protein kinase ephrin type A/B receptor-like
MSFNQFEGGITCSPCFAGQELENNLSIRNTGCVDCKPGYYAYTPGDYSAYTSLPSYVTGLYEKCTECPPNTYSGPRAAECITCPSGTTNNAARTACVPTSNPSPTRAPTTAPPTRLTNPLLTAKCLPGQGLSPCNYEGGCSGGNVCYDCPKGKYSADGIDCVVCPRGTYASESRSTQCTQVPLGQVVNADSTGGITCQAGYYAPNPAGPALVQGFDAVKRLKSCIVCPPDMYSRAGQDRCERCPVNTEVNSSKDGCTPCAKNLIKNIYMAVCQPEYF